MQNLLKSISKKEWRWLALMALAVAVVTSIPYLYGYVTQPEGMVYTGLHYLTPGDTNVYLSMIEQVKQGNNIFLNLYSSEPQAKLMVNPFWLAVGYLGKVFHLSNLLTLHVARIICLAGFIMVMYLMLAYLFSRARIRKWALAVILFSSGLGLFFNPFLFNLEKLIEHPVDTWVPESITLLTLYNFPHIIASLALIVLIFLLMLFAFDTNKPRYSLGAGAAMFFLIWFHPFNGPTVLGVILVYMLMFFVWRRKIIWSYLKHFFVLGIAAVPPALYLYLLSRVDWMTEQWNKQNILPSPSVWMYLIGYGLVFLLALVGLWISLKKPDNKGLFLIAWTVTSAMLLYIPLSFQRRLSEGLHIPLAILATIGVFYILERKSAAKKTYKYWQYAVFLFLMLFLPMNNIQMLGQDIYLYDNAKQYPFYLKQDEVAAMVWLKNNTAEDVVIFSCYDIGNFIPAYSGRFVWIGHGPQTINLRAKQELSAWFWQDDQEAARKYRLLLDGQADYLYYSGREKKFGTYDPAAKDYLQAVYRNSEVVIYRVLK